MMRRPMVLMLGLVATAPLAACRESEAEREEKAMRAATPQRLQADGSIRLSDADRTAAGIEVGAATEGDVPDVVVRLGRVRARLDEEALVVSPIAGRVVRAPDVALGADVAAGTNLVAINPVLTTAERVSLGVQSADSAGQAEAATKELSTREAELARAKELSSANIVSAAQLQQAETAVVTTRARLEALRRSRALQTQGQGGEIVLKAPTTGTVVMLNAVVGTVVKPGDVLARVLKAGPRWIDVSVPADDVIGQRYEAGLGEPWTAARLLTKGAVVEDDGARHDRLEVEAAGALRLLPGATVTVRVGRGTAKGIVVPETALVPAPGTGGDIVYVEATAGVFTPRAVAVAARFGGQARIASGLGVGEKIVTKGAMVLRGESLRADLRHQE